MSAAAWTEGVRVYRGGRPTQARLPVAFARVPAFLLLAAFGASAWGAMVEPGAGGAMTGTLLAALAGAAPLIVVARRGLARPARAIATAVVAVALLVVALLAAGIPAHFLGPGSWDELAAGINQGLGTVPDVRVPYHGVDAWVRHVIVLGGTVLIALAALLAFVPRRSGAFGYPLVAAIALTTLYLVPVMQHDSAHQFWRGAIFALLLAAFLWLERVERRAAPLAAWVVLVAVVAGLLLGPGLDRSSALLDYESIAQALSSASSQRYDWNHDYGPLNARDEREVLRVQAPHRAYWKATNLALFDGLRWLEGNETTDSGLDGALPRAHPEWLQQVSFTVRSLVSSQFVTAGSTLAIDRASRQPVLTGPGEFTTQGQPLKKGNGYRATVYTPRPTDAQLRAASLLPLPADTDGTGLTAINLPAARGSIGPATRLLIPAWGEGDPTPDAVAAIEASPYAGVYKLARELRARSQTPYEFMRAVENHLANGYTYSENPRRSAVPLVDFLFNERAGYCQQFSGAMALLLRFGGVPARVAAGFAPGALDTKRHEYVVRDIDAHSWVEVFFPGIGWVTRDPTPGDAPARSQTSDTAPAAAGPVTPLRDPSPKLPARRIKPDPLDGSAPRGSTRDDAGPPVIPLVIAAVLVAVGAALLVRRRRRRPPHGDRATQALAELGRALRRSGRPLSTHTTLDVLATRWRDTPAEAYLRALTAGRYGYGDGRPTRAQRAALRRALAAGGGLRGQLRAWWALPPRVARD